MSALSTGRSPNTTSQIIAWCFISKDSVMEAGLYYMRLNEGNGEVARGWKSKRHKRGSVRSKVEMPVAVADRPVVVFDVMVMRDVAKGATQQSSIV